MEDAVSSSVVESSEDVKTVVEEDGTAVSSDRPEDVVSSGSPDVVSSISAVVMSSSACLIATYFSESVISFISLHFWLRSVYPNMTRINTMGIG